jgi:hypothetical protein
VAAFILNGVELATDVEDGDGTSVDRYLPRLARGHFSDLRYYGKSHRRFSGLMDLCILRDIHIVGTDELVGNAFSGGPGRAAHCYIE